MYGDHRAYPSPHDYPSADDYYQAVEDYQKWLKIKKKQTRKPRIWPTKDAWSL